MGPGGLLQQKAASREISSSRYIFLTRTMREKGVVHAVLRECMLPPVVQMMLPGLNYLRKVAEALPH